MAIRTQWADGQFSWVELRTDNLQDAGDFYGQLFGWECHLSDAPGASSHGQFRLQDYLVAGIRQPGDAPPSENGRAVWHSFVRVADVQQAADRAVALGGKITTPRETDADTGTMVMIQDPAGAEVGLWREGRPLGAQLVQDMHAVCWNELCTRDIAAAQRFYQELLGWEFSEHPLPMTEYHLIENQGEQNGGMMLLDQRWGTLPPRWLVYFAVESVDFRVDQVRQLGGDVFVPPCDIPEGRMAMVTDRHGAMFNLVQMDETDD